MSHSTKNFLSRTAFLFCIILAFPAISGAINPTTHYVSTDGSNTSPYDTWAKAATSIQTAINTANAGDTIIVGSSDGHGLGIYTENVVVNKQVILKSENGFLTTTVVAADSTAHVFNVTADQVTISGFSAYGGTQLWFYGDAGNLLFLPAGINLDTVSYCLIKDCRCGWDSTHQNSSGITLTYSDSCVISNTIASHNIGQGIPIIKSKGNTFISDTVNNNQADGISLSFSSSDNVFISNTVNNNGFDGFMVVDSKNNIFNNNIVSGNGNHGFQISLSTNNTLIGNTANDNVGHGFYLAGSADSNTLQSDTAIGNSGVGIGLDMSSHTLVTSCTVKHNQYGMFIGGGSHNTISSNIMNDNDGRPDGDGIMLDGSSYNTLANNTMDNDPGDGIEFYQASNNYVTGNSVINSNAAVRINYYSANNVLSNNTVNNGLMGIILEEEHTVNNVLANNITNGNSAHGIFIYRNSSNNILVGNTSNNNMGNGILIIASDKGNSVYLNNLSGNGDKNISVEDTNNTWHSPVALNFDYNKGTLYKGYLGNYYGDGNHTGNHGTGGPYILGTGIEDDYQLLNTSDNYSMQAWWLNSDSNMYWQDATRRGDSVLISSGGNFVWKTDYAATGGIDFSDSDCWTGQVVFTSAPASGHTFTVEVGSYNGTNFVAGGPEATIVGDDSTKTFTFQTDTGAFTVSGGDYLAFRITSNDAENSIRTGGAWSFISSPANSTNYLLSVDHIPENQPHFSLSQNFPNPFSFSTKIEFTLPKAVHVAIRLFDLSGREVATLLNEDQKAGSHSIEFNAGNLSNGVYFYRLECGNYSEIKKMSIQR